MKGSVKGEGRIQGEERGQEYGNGLER